MVRHARWLNRVASAGMAVALLASCASSARSSGTPATSVGGGTSVPSTTVTTVDPFQAERIAQQQATQPGFFQVSFPRKFIADKDETVTATISPSTVNGVPNSTSSSSGTSGSTTPQLPIRISTTMAVVLDAVGATVTNESPDKQPLLLIGTEQTTWQWLVKAAEPPLGQTSYDLHLVFHVSFFVHPDDQSGVEVTPAPVRDVVVSINTRKSIGNGVTWIWKALVALAGLGVFGFIGRWWAKRRKENAAEGGDDGGESQTDTDSPHDSVKTKPPAHGTVVRNSRRHKTHRR